MCLDRQQSVSLSCSLRLCRAISSFSMWDHLSLCFSLFSVTALDSAPFWAWWLSQWSSMLLCAESLWWSVCTLWSATGCSRKVHDNCCIVPQLSVRPNAWSLDGQHLYWFSRSFIFIVTVFMRYSIMCGILSSCICSVLLRVSGSYCWVYLHDDSIESALRQAQNILPYPHIFNIHSMIHIHTQD